MFLYKYIKDFIANYIPKEKVKEYYDKGYLVIKEFDSVDIEKSKYPEKLFEIE